MNHSFTCPDCGCEHCEPFEATFVLYVRCWDCALLLALAPGEADPGELLAAAA